MRSGSVTLTYAMDAAQRRLQNDMCRMAKVVKGVLVDVDWLVGSVGRREVYLCVGLPARAQKLRVKSRELQHVLWCMVWCLVTSCAG